MLGHFFQCDPDLRLTGTEVYLDPAESRQIGLISHGHSDHIGRHKQFVATPATAAFLRHRQGMDLRGVELPYGTSHQIGEHTVELFPAGHVLGSAMIRVTSNGERLLYTGDFKLRSSLTSEPAQIVECDSVIMESTFGSPEWRFPPAAELGVRLCETVQGITARGKTAVVLAYSLGKAQEAMAILHRASLPVVLHPTVARISAIYQRLGVDLGEFEVWSLQSELSVRTTTELRGKTLILPPHLRSELRKVRNAESIALTGWALNPARTRDADHGIPLSDHADFDELIDFAIRCRARTIYVTHGSRRFAKELRLRGFNAQFLTRKPQMRLF